MDKTLPTAHKRRISFLIIPKLESVYIIGLKDLRRLLRGLLPLGQQT